MAPGLGQTEYEQLGKIWLGLGNLEAKVWFIGMEPGGNSASDLAWAREWATKFEGSQTVDLHASATAKEMPFLGQNNRLHSTWSPLIRFQLAYAGRPTDDESVLRYQREDFATAKGREALLEVSAYSAKGLSEPSPRKKYLKDRVDRLSACIESIYKPEVVVFYGKTYASYYEEIVHGAFDATGFRWLNETFCALTLHPYQQFGKSPPPEFWITLGIEMRRRVTGGRI